MTDNNKNIDLIEYTKTMEKDYMDYAIEVAKFRAIPDGRDGLKPVHRRILFAMQELGLYPEADYRKCARIVGDVLGKYHPHGDSSVYDALVRMAQDFKMNLPLVDGHGNFGSIDGDNAAAMRYTEAKMTPATKYMLSNLEKGVVDFKDNFDGTLKEPSVLPSVIPNLLINGSSGIAVGLATNIPPHNPIEVIDTILKFMSKKNVTTKELVGILKAPDYPTGGVITNKKDILSLYENGKGSLNIRAKIEKEDGSYGKTNLIIKEIPYTASGSKGKLIDDIIDLVNNKKLEEISDVRDESSKTDMRVVLELKKNVNVDKFLNKLYKKSKLEDKEDYEFLVLKNGIPKNVNLKELIEIYVDFQKEILIKKNTYLLNKSESKAEILNGLWTARNNIDLILEIIRGSSTVKQAKLCLINGETENIKFKTKKSEKEAKKLNFTENQANAVLEMRLQKLVGLELDKLKKELDVVLSEIELYKKILSSDIEIEKEIKKQLKELKKILNFKRKTEVKDIENVVYKEEFIEEEVCVALDKFNYIKTINPNYYNDDNKKNYKYMDKLMNTEKIRVFSNLGRVYQIKVQDIVFVKISDKGTPIESLCGMKKNEFPIYIESNNVVKENEFLVATKLGLIKKITGIEFETTRKNISFNTLNKNDEVISITLIDDKEDDVIVVTHKGNALKYDLNEVNDYKKTAKGDKSVSLDENDFVEETALISRKCNFKINGKEYDLKNLEKMHRNSKSKSLV